MEKITSRANEKIRFAARLRDSSAFRRETGLFLVEGARLCADAALSGMLIEQAYFTDEAAEKYAREISEICSKSASVCTVSVQAAQAMADTVSTQGVFCVCKTLDKCVIIDKIKDSGKYIALENIQNPANLGSVCRTAEALGLDGIILGGGCDIHNPKAQRAAMGSLFRMPVFIADSLPVLLARLREGGMSVWGSTPSPGAVEITSLNLGGGTVCVIGNEGNGISPECADACTGLVTIPMRGRAESLNAATAAAIIMWEMQK